MDEAHSSTLGSSGIATTTSATATTTTIKSSNNGNRIKKRPVRTLKFSPPPSFLPPLIHFSICRPDGERINMDVGLVAIPAIKTTTTTINTAPITFSTNNTTRSVNLMTEKLLEIFGQCNASFRYNKNLNPRRVLTKPSRPHYNNGWDNEKHDYILYVNDVLGNEEGRKYVIMDLLGQGTFGQVVKCQNVKTRELVAVKVIKNQAAFFNQSMMEVTVLEMLNQKYDKEDKHHIVRMRDTFVFRQHLCIVVELLSLNLYDLIKQNQYRGFSLTLCRLFLTQILDAMKVLKEARIIHCDLKPENILLRNLESPGIKVIDFGSACHEHQTLYTYIQSRFYRSPEVLLGLPYSSSIDMWSLGCIAAELFLGLPIFPGSSNYDQVNRIVTTLGLPLQHMLEVGKDTLTYFERSAGRIFQLKSRDKYSMDTGRVEPPPKQYFNSTRLDEIILNYPIRPRDMSVKDKELEMANRKCFLDFIKGLLNLNPIERWSPLQAVQHPFITGKPFISPFIPQPTATSTMPVPQAGINVTTGSRIKAGGVATNAAIANAIGNGSNAIGVAVGTTTRPRANTLSSLSLQDVPAQIQRITAAAKDKKAPGIGPTERSDTIPEVHTTGSIDGIQPPSLPFESYLRGQHGSSISGVNLSSANGNNNNNPSANHLSFGNTGTTGNNNTFNMGERGMGDNYTNKASTSTSRQKSQSKTTMMSDRMSAYVSNRRVSQPVISGSGRLLQKGIGGGVGGNSSFNNDELYAIPSSVPNAVWYGTTSNEDVNNNNNNNSLNSNSASPQNNNPAIATTTGRRNSSSKNDDYQHGSNNAGIAAAPNLTTKNNNNSPNLTSRRASAPLIQINSIPTTVNDNNNNNNGGNGKKKSNMDSRKSNLSTSFVIDNETPTAPFPMTLDGEEEEEMGMMGDDDDGMDRNNSTSCSNSGLGSSGSKRHGSSSSGQSCMDIMEEDGEHYQYGGGNQLDRS